MTFDDLVFKPSPFSQNKQARADFPNGYGISCVIGPYTYGGLGGLYEAAVFHNGDLCYDTPITDDVIGHLTPEEVTALLAQIEALPEVKE